MGKFIHKKSFGQNFLCNENIVQKIIEQVDIDKNTLVIEIGPGQGVLSKYLVPASGMSILYEIDERLESYLDVLLAGNDNYMIVFNDFLKCDVNSDISKYNYDKLYLVANLPYYITTPIVTKLIDEHILPDKIVIMVQQEVAARYSALVNSRAYSSLTVFLNYYYDIHKLFDVSRNCFDPVPSVDSSVILMELKHDFLSVKDMDFFKRIVKDSFRYKRKNLRNNLKNYDLNKLSSVLSKNGFSLNDRAENITLEVFVAIANELV